MARYRRDALGGSGGRWRGRTGVPLTSAPFPTAGRDLLRRNQARTSSSGVNAGGAELAAGSPARIWRLLPAILMLLMALLANGGARAGGNLLDYVGTEGDASGTITLPVAPGGHRLLPLYAPPDTRKLKELVLQLTPFTGPAGEPLQVTPTITVAGLPDWQPDATRYVLAPDTELKEAILPLQLTVGDLASTGDYTGNLLITAGETLQSVKIIFKRPQVEANLEITPSSLDLYWTNCWFFCQPPSFTVPVRNAGGGGAAGLSLRLIDVKKPEGTNFDLATNLTLYWNGEERSNLLQAPATGASGQSSPLAVAPNGQAVLGGEFHGLGPGTYTLQLGLAGSNLATSNSAAALTLTLNVRHAWYWAMLVLFVGILLSTVVTRVLATQRQRVGLLEKLSEITPAWLREEPPTLPVVAVRAVLRQADDRNRKWYDALFAPDIKSDRVAKAEQMLGPLSRIREIRRTIERWHHDEMIKRRVEKKLRDLVEGFDPDAAVETSVAAMGTQLTELEKWLDPATLPALYWADLKSDIDRLLAQVSEKDFPAQWQNKVIDLRQQLAQDPPAPADMLTNGPKREEIYAKLKIVHERLEDDDLNELFNKIDDNILTFFKVADQFVWNRLKQACTNGQDGFEFPQPRQNAEEPLRRYQLIEFAIAPKDRRLAGNYLFKHGLEYRWELTLTNADRTNLVLKQSTREPRLIQYLPTAGTLKVATTLIFKNDTTEIVSTAPFVIGKESDLGWRKSFRAVEVAAWGLATGFAIISGMSSFYFGKPVFGTIENYVTLLLWGSGVDQGKNFISYFSEFKPPSS
jgi:hypothetical protein